VALAVLAAAGWWWTSRATVRRESGLNVLLVTIDTLRADAVGAYGRAGGPTPWIDRLASAGVLFTNAYAHNVVTLPSHVNILTGQLPPEHGVRDNAGFRAPSSGDTLATVLQDRGYRTAAFVSAFPLDARFGLGRGFELYDDRFAEGPRPPFLIQERRGVDTIERARQWLAEAGEGPWFCWVHLYEPHYPYQSPEPFASRWPGDSYLGEVASADAALGPLLAPIVEAGSDGRTLVVVTSDHGESLGEHGEATHGIFAYESTLKVPLIVYQPRILRPRTVETVARHVDLLPTLLDALAMPLPDGLPGRSLLPAIATAGEPPDRLVYFEALSGSLNRGWAPLTGIIRGGFKYIDLPIPELYDLHADPHEQKNLAATDTARVSALRAQLDGIRSSGPVQAAHRESAEARERLRSLGYVTGSGAPPAAGHSEEDDPKRLIGLDTILQDILDRYLEGDLNGALTKGRDLVRRRPSMSLAWMHLAHLEREAGNLDAAVDAMRRAFALGAGNSEPLALLGAYLTEAGRAAEAADLLEPAARASDADTDVLTSRALALARLNRTNEALATLSRARQSDPSNAMLLVHVGTVELTSGNRAAARGAFEEALKLSPGLARAHSSLGVMSLEDGDRGRAVEHWKAATSRDPTEYGRILSLGIAFARNGRAADARACFEFFSANAPPSRYSRELDRVRTWLNDVR